MNKSRALNTALDVAKVALASCEIKTVLNAEHADNLADFVETLAKRLEKMDEDQDR